MTTFRILSSDYGNVTLYAEGEAPLTATINGNDVTVEPTHDGDYAFDLVLEPHEPGRDEDRFGLYAKYATGGERLSPVRRSHFPVEVWGVRFEVVNK